MNIKSTLLLLIALAALGNQSCKKQAAGSCYDKAFEDTHRNDICTADCPGVTGCDGKTYCNECVMHTKGITHRQ